MPCIVHVQIIKEQSNHSKKNLYLDKKTLSVYLCSKTLLLKVQNLMSLLEARVGDSRCLLRFLHLRGSWSWTAAQALKLFCHALLREQFSISHASSHTISRHVVFLWDCQSRRCKHGKHAHHIACSWEHFAFRKETNVPQN